MINIKTISSVNSKYIFLNDEGIQTRKTTTFNDIAEIKTQIKIELSHINYMINRLESDCNMYMAKIDSLNSSISKLKETVNNGVINNVPIFKRGLAAECSDIEYYSNKINNICMMMAGCNDSISKLLNDKMKYEGILKVCEVLFK